MKTSPEFAGVPSTLLGEARLIGEHNHHMGLRMYRFPDGSEAPYVEVTETGEFGGERVVALSTAVHALLNLGEDEIFVVGNREGHNALANLEARVVKCAEETQKACAEAAQYKERFARAEEELQETRARADKAESDLSSCLAVTNEALQEALAHGRETEDGPNRALVQAVRAAARLGAEEMREQAALEALAAKAKTPGMLVGLAIVAGRIRFLPLPGDEVKPKHPPSHSMHCLPFGRDSWSCGEGCTVRDGES